MTQLICATMREHLGRGPELVKVFSNADVVIVEMRGVLSDLEKALVRHGNVDLVWQIREYIHTLLRPFWEQLFANEFSLTLVKTESSTDVLRDRRIFKFHVEKSCHKG